jgi:hypothetical protein
MRVVYQEQTNEVQISGIPSGERLVSNVLEQKWSRYKSSGVSTKLTKDMCVARGKHWRLEGNVGATLVAEELYAFDGDDYNAGSEVGWQQESPWYKPADVGGQLRVWRMWLSLALSEGYESVTIDLTYYTDYNTSVAQTASWSGAELDALADAGESVVQLPFYPEQQICKAFKFLVVCTVGGAASGAKPLSMRVRFGVRDSKGKRLRAAVKG